jgi:methylenetetrahydrofolate dehydrogenase (NADP+)/methenyltetrahydrofolate cyclohydrolase
MIIDGKAIAKQIQQEIAAAVRGIAEKSRHARMPCLAVIIVGDHPASKIYVERKTKACLEVGILSRRIELSKDTPEKALIKTIETLNADDAVDGILVQLPLPPQINPLHILHKIDPSKDVDGLHPYNVGKMLIGDADTFFPCTPLGIKEILIRSKVQTSGRHAIVVGRSNLVGKPMAAILMQNADGGNATVTIANSQTKNLKEFCKMADIVIAAVGQPKLITADMVKTGAVVIDVGINKIDADNAAGYTLVGDVDFDKVQEVASLITPVPGGVGPMTIVMLLSNTLKSYTLRTSR